MLKDHEIQEIHQAMTLAGGDFEKAAQILGFKLKDLKLKIRNQNMLRRSWGTPELHLTKPDEAPTVPVESSLVLSESDMVPKKEFSLMAAVEEQDAQLKQGLVRLGLSDHQAQRAFEMQDFYGRQFSKCVDMLGTGLIVTSMALLELIESQQKLIREKEESGTWEMKYNEDGRLQFDEKKREWEILIEAQSEYRELAEMAQDAALTRQKIEAMKIDRATSLNGKKRVGFGVLTANKTETHIHAAPGSTITVNETKAPEKDNDEYEQEG